MPGPGAARPRSRTPKRRSAAPAAQQPARPSRETATRPSENDILDLPEGRVIGCAVPNPSPRFETDVNEDNVRSRRVRAVITSTAGLQWVTQQAEARRAHLQGTLEGTPFDQPAGRGSPSTWLWPESPDASDSATRTASPEPEVASEARAAGTPCKGETATSDRATFPQPTGEPVSYGPAKPRSIRLTLFSSQAQRARTQHSQNTSRTETYASDNESMYEVAFGEFRSGLLPPPDAAPGDLTPIGELLFSLAGATAPPTGKEDGTQSPFGAAASWRAITPGGPERCQRG